jgi:hypothetical protein
MQVNISKPSRKASCFTIVGDVGMGKSMIGANFPKPVFVRYEDGLLQSAFPQGFELPDCFDLVTSFNHVVSQLMFLLRGEHDYQTVVFDTITTSEPIFIDDILQSESKKQNREIHTLKDVGGYGAGHQLAQAMHGRITNACKLLIEQRGMKVVFLAHTKIETIELPDKSPFQRFGIAMNEKCAASYLSMSDVVGHLRLESFILKDDPKKKVGKASSSGDREIICHASASNVCKNRLGITEPLAVQYCTNPFEQYL